MIISYFPLATSNGTGSEEENGTGSGSEGGEGTQTDNFPEFTYTGEYTIEADGDGWKLKLLTSGTLAMAENQTVDIFAVGGGAAGRSGLTTSSSFGTEYYGGYGGGGGCVSTLSNATLTALRQYHVVIGAGGEPYTSSVGTAGWGGSTTMDGYPNDPDTLWISVAGGHGNIGGSGGGSEMWDTVYNTSLSQTSGNGGSDGDDGGGSNPGNGQGTTTREFGEISGTLYAGGGAGGTCNLGSGRLGGAGGGGDGAYGYNGNIVLAKDGAANTGGGGGGGASIGTMYPNLYPGGHGGSGIMIIRDHRSTT